jgi:hypothetical protein
VPQCHGAGAGGLGYNPPQSCQIRGGRGSRRPSISEALGVCVAAAVSVRIQCVRPRVIFVVDHVRSQFIPRLVIQDATDRG